MTIGYGILGVFFVILVVNWVGVFGGSSKPQAAPPLSAAGRPYAAALAEVLTEPGAVWVGFSGLRPAEAECVAGAWVMILGPDQLDDAGTTPSELAEDPAGASRDAGFDWEAGKRLAAEYGRCGASPQHLIARGRLVAYQELGEDRPDDVDLDCLADEVAAGDADRAFIESLVPPTDEGPVAGPSGPDISDPRSYQPTSAADPGTIGILAPPRTPAERERFIRRAVDQCS